MLDQKPNRAAVTSAKAADLYEERRAELHRLPARRRIAAIEVELKKISPIPTTAATFHRKKLLRMQDAARLEAGLVTREELQRENDPFVKLDFSKARIVWQPRRVRA